jgi:hypothetical protein
MYYGAINKDSFGNASDIITIIPIATRAKN